MDKIILFGVPFFESSSFFHLLLRFVIDIIFITILIRGIYYPINKKRNYLFTFFIFNVLIFFVASLLSAVRLETGFAFGLFAVFSIIRYRTRQIPIKEMTFLFISIIIATINSTVTILISYSEIIFANVAILGVSLLMEKLWLKKYIDSKSILYEKIELIVPEKREELLEDLRKRTGLNVESFEVRRINLLRDTARIRIFYKSE
ncbi:MAG: DUF4956 domain-containing protein [Spirochaetales bacterium]|jgi:hypothetical protein|nr:DUF4956 domain-containing protein [Spirochaetales bacterium]